MSQNKAITVNKANFYCRTCLSKLHTSLFNGCSESDQILQNVKAENFTEISASYIDLTINADLLLLINLNVDNKVRQKYGEDCINCLSKLVCMKCYQVLTEFESFRHKAIKSALLMQSMSSSVTEESIKCAYIESSTKSAMQLPEEQSMEAISFVDVCQHDACTVNEFEEVKGAGNVSTKPEHGDVNKQLLRNSLLDALDTVWNENDNNLTPAPRTELPAGKIYQRKSTRRSTSSQKHRKGAAYRCLKCEKRFVHMLYYEAHVLQVHEGVRLPYVCGQCGKGYKGATSLKYHKYVAHELGSKTFTCHECSSEYRTEASLKRHRSSVHLGQKPTKRLVCEQCGATFISTRELIIHNKAKHVMVNGEPASSEYKCTHCSKIFQSPYTLNYHVLRAHLQQKDYTCSQCGEGFVKRFMLLAHMRSHAADADKFPCEECERRFCSKADRQRHVRVVHLKLKPYICGECGDAFATPKTLKHHSYIHTGEKPYICDICHQGYRQLTAMKRHRNTHTKTVGSGMS